MPRLAVVDAALLEASAEEDAKRAAALTALDRVDVVEADGGRADDLQVGRAVEELGVDVRVGEHHEPVRLGQPLGLDVLGLLRPGESDVHTASLQLGDEAILPAVGHDAAAERAILHEQDGHLGAALARSREPRASGASQPLSRIGELLRAPLAVLGRTDCDRYV